MKINEKELYFTLSEASAMLKISKASVRNLVIAGKLQAYKFCGLYRIQREDLIEYVRKSKIQPTA